MVSSTSFFIWDAAIPLFQLGNSIFCFVLFCVFLRERDRIKKHIFYYRKKNSVAISRIHTVSSRIKDKKKDCATKKLESPIPRPAFPQLQPFSFVQKYQNFTSVVKTSLCRGFSPASVTEPAAPWSHPPVRSPVVALADLGPGAATYCLFFHWAGIVFSPVSLLWQTEVALTLVVQSPPMAQLNQALQRCDWKFCY